MQVGLAARPSAPRRPPDRPGDTHGQARQARRPRRGRRQPLQAPRIRVPELRDLRRHPLGLGLRPPRAWSSRRTSAAQWWQAVVRGRDDVVGLDSSVILAPQVWEASGHVDAFVDPLTECRSVPQALPVDHLLEAFEEQQRPRRPSGLAEIVCPNCGTRGSSPSRVTSTGCCARTVGPVEDEGALHYLRPETAQGIFVNYANVANAARKKPPFGIGQTGKSLPQRDHARATSSSAPASSSRWRWSSSSSPAPTRSGTSTGSRSAGTGTSTSGIDPENLRLFEHPQEKLSHYSKRTVDIEYRFHFAGSEFAELEGIANRTDFDLSTHTRALRRRPVLLRPGDRRALVPVRHRAGGRADPRVLAFLLDAYDEDEAPNAKGGVDKRTVLRFDPRLAPVKVAVLPLSRNADLSPKARDLAAELRTHLERRVRRRRRDRPPLPPPGRDRHAVLRHRRLRHPRRPGRHGPRARLDGPGAGPARRAVRAWLAERLPGC